MASRLFLQQRTTAHAASRLYQTHVRTMASSTGRSFEFLAIVPDKPGMHQKRLDVRPEHFKNLTPHKESGKWKMGGALLNSVPEGDDATKFDFMGSTVVCIAESKEEVLQQLREDVYAKSGVWDVEKAQIYPFKCAFRNP